MNDHLGAIRDERPSIECIHGVPLSHDICKDCEAANEQAQLMAACQGERWPFDYPDVVGHE